jgi:hypothetical protein
MKAVSDRFISLATACMRMSSGNASRMVTAAGLPVNGSVVKASTTVSSIATSINLSGEDDPILRIGEQPLGPRSHASRESRQLDADGESLRGTALIHTLERGNVGAVPAPGHDDVKLGDGAAGGRVERDQSPTHASSHAWLCPARVAPSSASASGKRYPDADRAGMPFRRRSANARCAKSWQTPRRCRSTSTAVVVTVVQPRCRDEMTRDDTVGQDPARSIHVSKERFEREDPLAHPRLDRLPLLRREDTRYEIQRERAFLPQVGERDPLLAERAVAGRAAFLEVRSDNAPNASWSASYWPRGRLAAANISSQVVPRV